MNTTYFLVIKKKMNTTLVPMGPPGLIQAQSNIFGRNSAQPWRQLVDFVPEARALSRHDRNDL